MGRNDDLLSKQDPRDLDQYQELVKRAFKAKRKIETGFIELAESILQIHSRKLYKLNYPTFSSFCEEELGFSRQTVYVYISILKLINSFPDHFPREVAVDYGHKKMRYIAQGANAVDKRVQDEAERQRVKAEIFRSISPDMPSTEIEATIEEIVEEY